MQIPLANTILYCRHWRQTVNFYRDVLGFEESFARADWFKELRINSGCHLSLADAAHCSIEAGEGRGLTLSFQVQDLRAAHASLARAGHAPGAVTDNHPWRLPYFYVRDPEGNRIEFWSLDTSIDQPE